MVFRLRLKVLARFGHSMGNMLEAGLPITRALETLTRASPHAEKPLYRRLAAEIEGGGILSLHFIEFGEDKAKRLLSVRTHWRDGQGRARCARPGTDRRGQGAFPFGCGQGPAARAL